ncbi:MAG TPA: hydroxyisourate hydrolase [Thermoanaerobaculia bacterium]|nr:hydroxyisourate hydrolase [Thermoanaerobaculia bacterium]
MSGLSTHVLDLASGRPAAGVQVALEAWSEGGWEVLGTAATDPDGRVRELLPPARVLGVGLYRLTFAAGDYFRARGVESFHPEVAVVFQVREPVAHHHVPLLLAPWGYTTYRGT